MPFQFRKEAIEEDLNTNFPSQGQGNPPLYYSLSEVVVPTYSINNVAEGSTLPENLQTAFDFSTGQQQSNNSTDVFISNPGFWRIQGTCTFRSSTGSTFRAQIEINDGLGSKVVWKITEGVSVTEVFGIDNYSFVVFLRSGDSLRQSTNDADVLLETQYRQIADVNGNLVNPLGFSAA